MTLLVIIVHVVVCLVLILVILVQGGRGQGLTGPSFGSGNVQSLFGTRAADFLTKATSVSAICFLFTCIGLNIIETQKSRSLFEGARKSVPIDMDAIKKALEKVKQEKGTKTGAVEAPKTPEEELKKIKAEAADFQNSVDKLKATATESAKVQPPSTTAPSAVPPTAAPTATAPSQAAPAKDTSKTPAKT